MKTARTVLWIAVAAVTALLGWLTLEMQRPSGVLDEGPFGVAFSLIRQDGQPVTQAAFQGKPTALFFGFTHCPEVCPTTLFELNGWLEQVDPDNTRLQAYFVTVDPERDTTGLLRDYVTAVSKRIIGISGPPSDVNAMVKGFRVYARKVPVDESKPDGDYTMDHTASVFLLDSKGRFRGTISYGEDPDTARTKLKNLINS